MFAFAVGKRKQLSATKIERFTSWTAPQTIHSIPAIRSEIAIVRSKISIERRPTIGVLKLCTVITDDAPKRNVNICPTFTSADFLCLSFVESLNRIQHSQRYRVSRCISPHQNVALKCRKSKPKPIPKSSRFARHSFEFHYIERWTNISYQRWSPLKNFARSPSRTLFVNIVEKYFLRPKTKTVWQ